MHHLAARGDQELDKQPHCARPDILLAAVVLSVQFIYSMKRIQDTDTEREQTGSVHRTLHTIMIVSEEKTI